jgi:hypothetical protein
MSQIEEVSEYASKEYSLERTLDKMQGESGGWGDGAGGGWVVLMWWC